MRRAVLWRSMQRLLEPNEDLEQVAYVWARHRRMFGFALAAGLALTAVAWAVGFPTWASRLIVGAAGAAVAVNATTDYRVIGLTDRRIVVARASRIRQKAVDVVRHLDRDAPVERTGGGSFVTSTWQIGDRTYTVPRGSELAIEDIHRRLTS